MIDKNKIKEKIQKTPSKDILYLTVNPVDPRACQNLMKEIEKFICKKGRMVIFNNSV